MKMMGTIHRRFEEKYAMYACMTQSVCFYQAFKILAHVNVHLYENEILWLTKPYLRMHNLIDGVMIWTQLTHRDIAITATLQSKLILSLIYTLRDTYDHSVKHIRRPSYPPRL